MDRTKRTIKRVVTCCSAMLLTIALVGCSSGPENAAAPEGSSKPTQTQVLDRSVTIEPTTLVDDAAITVVADSLSFKSDNLYINLSFMNKSTDKLSVTAGTAGYDCNYINDYMVDGGWFSADIEPGETVQEETYFNASLLAMLGISEIREIGLGITVKNSQYNTLFQGPVNIKTSLYESTGEGTGNYQNAMKDRSVLSRLNITMKKFSTVEAFSQNGIRVVSEALAENVDGDKSLLLETVNDSTDIAGVRLSNIVINGEMAYEGYWTGEIILPGKQAIMTLNFASMIDDDEQDRFDLNNIRTITFQLDAKDENSNTIIPNTEVTINI